eukprot:SAG11_NODE_227_length_11995_cov_4.386601_6_plen_70_part_00
MYSPPRADAPAVQLARPLVPAPGEVVERLHRKGTEALRERSAAARLVARHGALDEMAKLLQCEGAAQVC